MSTHVIKRRRRSQVTSNGLEKHTSRLGSRPLYGDWGIVKAQDSATNSVDVELSSGLVAAHLEVRSLEWAGYNTNYGFGERDLPPLEALVFVLFPDGLLEEGFVLCSALSPLGDPAAKQQEDLLIADKEDERVRVLEIGWKETYDKGTGKITLDSQDGTTIEIDRVVGQVRIATKDNGLFMMTDAVVIDSDTGNSKTIQLNGMGRTLVTHAELNTALQAFKTTYYNVHTHLSAAPGVPTGPPVIPGVIDISAADAPNLETGV